MYKHNIYKKKLFRPNRWNKFIKIKEDLEQYKSQLKLLEISFTETSSKLRSNELELDRLKKDLNDFADDLWNSMQEDDPDIVGLHGKLRFIIDDNLDFNWTALTVVKKSANNKNFMGFL